MTPPGLSWASVKSGVLGARRLPCLSFPMCQMRDGGSGSPGAGPEASEPHHVGQIVLGLSWGAGRRDPSFHQMPKGPVTPSAEPGEGGPEVPPAPPVHDLSSKVAC